MTEINNWDDATAFGAADLDDPTMPVQSDAEMAAQCEEEAYSGCYDYEDKRSRRGLYLGHKLAHDPRTKRYAKHTTSEERAARVLELKAVYYSDTASRKQKEDAMYEIYCVLYAFVHQLITRFCAAYIKSEADRDDFTQMALAEISDKLPFYDGGVLSSYYFIHIKHVLIAAIAQLTNTTRYYNEVNSRVAKVYSQFIAEGKAPADITAVDISAELPDVSVKAITAALSHLNNKNVSVDTLGELTSEEPTPTEAFEKKEKITALVEAIDNLDEIPSKVIRLAYGIPGGVPMNQKQISETLGLSLDTVRKAIAEAKKGIKKALEKKGYTESSIRKKQKEERSRSGGSISFTDLMGDNTEKELVDTNFSGNGEW